MIWCRSLSKSHGGSVHHVKDSIFEFLIGIQWPCPQRSFPKMPVSSKPVPLSRTDRHLVSLMLSGLHDSTYPLMPCAGRISQCGLSLCSFYTLPFSAIRHSESSLLRCRRENPILPSPPLYHSFRAPAVSLSLIHFLDILGLRNPWEP